MTNRLITITAGAIALASAGLALAASDTANITPPAEGSVTVAQGLDAWSRIYEVTPHPRCSNCHTGEGRIPMWSGPSFGKTRKHGMNIKGDESGMGVEGLPCATCHINSELGNDIPHAAPKVPADWRLAPVEAHWFGKSSPEICNQLRDPERNGGRTNLEVAEHVGHDVILHWAWNPGGNREAAPYSLNEHINDLLHWGVAGMPCPTE